MVHVIWSHGWGFDREFFQPLAQEFPDHDHTFIDWGYFNSPSFTLTQIERPLIGVGHSLGFAKLFDLPLSYNHVISLGGFTRFCQHGKGDTGTPKRILERMIHQFQVNPDRVLEDFYEACGRRRHFKQIPPLTISSLLKDLHRLGSLNIPLSHCPYTAIAGREDTICPLAHQQKMFSHPLIVGGGHGFPLTHSEETSDCLRKILNPIQSF